MTRILLRTLLLCLFLSADFAAVPEALADYYKYTDSQGMIGITNKLDSVPAKYRSTMKVVREEPKKAAGAGKGAQQPERYEPEVVEATAPEQADAAVPAQAPAGKFAELSARFVWFKPLAYLAGFLTLFVAIVKVTSLVPSPLLSKMIYLGFFLGVFVFVYQAYVAHVVESSLKIKENAASMMKKSTVRELPETEVDADNSAQK